MNSAQKTNLRKLSFLGFGPGNVNEIVTREDAKLDEECAKVFAIDDLPVSTGFDINKFQDPPEFGQTKQYDKEKELHHRKKSYPHTHIPLKVGSKSMKRRFSHQPSTKRTDIVNQEKPTEEKKEEMTIQMPNKDYENLLRSTILMEETDPGNSSESECVLSDPCSYGLPKLLAKRVAFDKDDSKDESDNNNENGLDRMKLRKYSLPDDPNQRKKHHHHHRHHLPKAGKRRVSVQPEDLRLKDADRDQLDSHRSDDSRGLRRSKISRPSNNLVHIARKEGNELHHTFNKIYDHSPHAIFVELDELVTKYEESEWKETARWIKYEEDVEEGVDRWGKPHVASLSFHSLLNLRKCLEDGLVLLDLEEKDLPAIAYRVSEDLYKEDLIREDDKGKIMRALLLRHRHVNEHHERSFKFSKKHSYTSLQYLWLEGGSPRCSFCMSTKQECPVHCAPRRPSFPHNLHEIEKRKISFPFDNHHIKNGTHIDMDNKLLPKENHVIDFKNGEENTYTGSSDDIRNRRNDAILKRIPEGAQGSSILVGEVDFLEQPAVSFIRLAEGIIIPSLIEVNIPVRFIFILLGPKRANLDYHEVGRSISTLMANKHFHNIAYGAYNRKALLSAINEFLDDSIVLPPGDWERQALLPIEELKAKSQAIKRRKETALQKAAQTDGLIIKQVEYAESDKEKKRFNPLERTRKPWGGLINDLKQRYPFYLSDIKDGINAQCTAAAIFMYFAALSGAVAFGGLLSSKTEDLIGTSETLVCTCVSGIIFALLSGQPMVIIGTTGPLLLFDESLYQFCITSGIDFLIVRAYIGFWLAVIGVVVACLEGSVLVKLFTRFTEDIFSALIVLLYIMESVVKLFILYDQHPLLANYCSIDNSSAAKTERTIPAISDLNVSDVAVHAALVASEDFSEKAPCENNTRDVSSSVMVKMISQPNTALFCTVLALGTFAIAYYLKMFRNSQFLGRSARRALGDFGVPIAIIAMVLIDYMVPQIYTEKLTVPEGLSPSTDSRKWLIFPSTNSKSLPLWVMFACIIPAMLVYILLFMETHITELIIQKRKLKKGSGFHLDIVLICLCNIISGFFGLPWVCAATVRSIAHVSALTVMSRTHAPGEKPHLIEVKEQRISALTVAILIGLSVLMAPLLRLVPMSVLFGVFLYMGVASIDGIQFFDRIKLFFMPVKHHPQACYVRKVKTGKMHLFTLIQLMCLVILWIVKSSKASLVFPFFLVLMVPLRAQLTYIFSNRELRALDGEQQDVEDDEPDFYAEALLPG